MVKLFGFLDNGKNKVDSTRLLRSMSNSFKFGKADYAVTYKFGIGHIKIPSMNKKGIIEDDNLIVCVTGEIFNNEKKDRSEEQFILESYKNEGTKFISKLNGTFVFVIYEKNNGKLLIVNDRHGMKPIYYYSDKEKIVFGSEIKAVIQDDRIDRKINWDFWNDFFTYNHTLRNDTPFQDIKSLPNASILEYSNGKTKIKQYWDYDKIKINHKRSEEETIEQGAQVIKNIIQRQTFGVKECNLLLSGGYDSRCLASAIKKYTNVKITAYTTPKNNVGKNTFKDTDVKYAKLVAKKLKIIHNIVPAEDDYYKKYLVSFIEQQEAMGYENMWMMQVINALNPKYKNFDGLAGDVFLRAGYMSKPSFSYHKDITNKKMLNKLNDKQLTSLFTYYLKQRSMINPNAILNYFNSDVRKNIKSDKKMLLALAKNLRKQDNGIKIFQAKYRTKNLICLQPNNLIMRKSYSRTPFLDNEFVEFGFSIPPQLKMKKDIYGEILQRSFPDVMAIPTTNNSHGLKSIIKKLIVRNEFTFLRYTIGAIASPFKRIFKKTKTESKLSDNPRDVKYIIKLAKNIDMPDFIDKKSLIQDIDNHVKMDKDPTYFLEPILHFCLWHNNFFKDEKHPNTDSLRGNKK